jgi:hypothetical protein
MGAFLYPVPLLSHSKEWDTWDKWDTPGHYIFYNA